MQIAGPRPSDRNSYLCKGHCHCVCAEIEKQKAETNKTVRLKEIEANKEAQMSQQAAIQAVKTEEAITATKQADLRLETLRAEQLVDKKIENEK